MAPLPRPLLGLILLANPLLFLLPGPVQGAPLEANVPTQSWNATGPSNSSHLVPKPPRSWSPAPFFWNDDSPRPYHAYGSYDPDKAEDDARGSVNVVDKGSKAQAETEDGHGHEHEHVDDVETLDEDGK
ncbi:hypothetical protein N8T08_008229 [Aspergillus melleus]|uniref:Uncharacterized protein n=1 Tax=Aspergillus melleus TaxID=138277 RepID=A0ACC3AVW0_9EURO|nr:hypothetical protein N8T08_008229 [Aspergillus melleus]